jgi:putative endonuclease
LFLLLPLLVFAVVVACFSSSPLYVFAVDVVCFFAAADVCSCRHPERSEGPEESTAATFVRTFQPRNPTLQRTAHARRPHRRHLFEHRNGIKSGFASKYGCDRRLLHEHFVDIRSAIAREKEIKGWTRAKKLALISKTNPEFKDLAVQHGWMMLHPQQNIADQ